MKEWLRKEKTIDRLAPFAAIIFGLFVGFILILITKNNPFEGFKYLFEGGFGFRNGEFTNFKKIGNILMNASPLILAGLAVAFSFKTGIFNIGVSGQMLIGGVISVYAGYALTLPKIIHIPVVLVVGAAAGALWAFIPALLKAKYKVNEVVTTIMMNYIALEFVKFFVKTLMPHPEINTESLRIADSASLRVEWMYDLFSRSNVNLGLFVALIVAVIYTLVLNRTTFGYELKAVGLNKDASEYAGIKVNKRILHSLMISGAIAGLAGVVFYLGNTDHIKLGHLPTLGFDGIVVALIGLNSAIGIFFASLLFSFFKVGSGFMKAKLSVPNQIVDIMIAVIIYFSATSLLFKNILKKMVKEKNKGGVK